MKCVFLTCFFFQAEDGIRDGHVTGVQTCALPIYSTIQFRMLNKSKGPAMWSPRSQNDRMDFAQKWRQTVEENKNIDFWQEMVTGIIVKDNRAIGVYTSLGLEIPAK